MLVRTLIAYRRVLAAGFLFNLLMFQLSSLVFDSASNCDITRQKRLSNIQGAMNIAQGDTAGRSAPLASNNGAPNQSAADGGGQQRSGDASNHIRAYMNPIRTLLQQDNWTAEFTNEIRKYFTPDIQGPAIVTIPKVADVQPNTLKMMPPSALDITQPGVDCAKLFRSDPEELIRVETAHDNLAYTPGPPDAAVYDATRRCDHFRWLRGYVRAVSPEEAGFPVAFSILVYENTALLERLLRAIYRPNNLYCIHVDDRAPASVRYAARSLVDCFSNVVMASRSVAVEWGRYGVLEADLICLRDLWELDTRLQRNTEWKYFINLTGHEFPLKTNWEMVQILKAYNGAVDVGATTSRAWTFRIKCDYYWHLKNKTCLHMKQPLPYNFTYAKGPVHVALSREAARFVLFSPIAQSLLTWLNSTIVPDESFFATLFYNPQLGIPGAYKGVRNTRKRAFHPVVRYKKWTWWRPCRGRAVRHICVATLWDLPELKVRPELFINKFDGHYHRLAYTCLEELHINKTLEEAAAWRVGSELHFDTRAYGALPWFRDRVGAKPGGE